MVNTLLNRLNTCYVCPDKRRCEGFQKKKDEDGKILFVCLLHSREQNKTVEIPEFKIGSKEKRLIEKEKARLAKNPV